MTRAPRQRDAFLRGALVVAVVAAGVAALLRAPWALHSADGRVGMQAGRAPVWSSPRLPEASRIADSLRVSEQSILDGSYALRVAPDWACVVLEGLLFTAVGIALVFVVQRVTHRGVGDPLLALVRWCWLGGGAGALLSCALWWVGGGWGAPFLLLATGLGAMVGAVLAITRRQRTCSTATFR